jgi:hypothetical protein
LILILGILLVTYQLVRFNTDHRDDRACDDDCMSLIIIIIIIIIITAEIPLQQGPKLIVSDLVRARRF